MNLSPLDVSIFVVAGGPLGGKTDVMTHLERVFDNAPVEFIPEAATFLLEGPVRFIPFPATPEEWATPRGTRWSTYFQVAVYAAQVVQLKHALRNAKKRGTKVICWDRGPLDLPGYVPDDLLELCYEMIAVEDTLWFQHITSVLFLDSVAHHSPAIFAELVRSNPARRETLDEAIAVNTRLRSSWMRHPRVHVFNGAFTMDQAKQTAEDEIRRLLEA